MMRAWGIGKFGWRIVVLLLFSSPAMAQLPAIAAAAQNSVETTTQSPGPLAGDTPDPLNPQLPNSLLQRLRRTVVNCTAENRVLGIPFSESDLYYEVLHRAMITDYDHQRAVARANLQNRRESIPRFRDNPEQEFPLFVDMFQHPEQYQGELVTLKGHSQQIIRYPATENPYGIETLYEVWLYTEDSQQNPAVVVCTSLPEGVRPGSRIVDHISVAGYFFKAYGYRARDATRVAPMILAQRIRWTPPGTAESALPVAVFYAGVVAMAGAIVVALWQIHRNDRRLREMRREREAANVKLDELHDVEAHDESSKAVAEIGPAPSA